MFGTHLVAGGPCNVTSTREKISLVRLSDKKEKRGLKTTEI